MRTAVAASSLPLSLDCDGEVGGTFMDPDLWHCPGDCQYETRPLTPATITPVPEPRLLASLTRLPSPRNHWLTDEGKRLYSLFLYPSAVAREPVPLLFLWQVG